LVPEEKKKKKKKKWGAQVESEILSQIPSLCLSDKFHGRGSLVVVSVTDPQWPREEDRTRKRDWWAGHFQVQSRRDGEGKMEGWDRFRRPEGMSGWDEW
jgi:hypothetical protein